MTGHQPSEINSAKLILDVKENESVSGLILSAGMDEMLCDYRFVKG